MTGIEFVVVLAWVLVPPFAIVSIVLASLGRRGPAPYARHRRVEAWLLMLVLSVLLGFAFVVWSPATIGRHIGIQDTPFMWAPFAFIAVALALVPAVWWAGRGVPR